MHDSHGYQDCCFCCVGGMVNQGQKFPCLFLGTGSLSQTVAVSVLQYHIIPNRVYTYDQLKQLADTADFMATTAFAGQTLNVSTGTFKLNGYAKIDKPDIYQSYARQKIHGIDSMLIPPGMQVIKLELSQSFAL